MAPDAFVRRVERILRTTPLIDGHDDLHGRFVGGRHMGPLDRVDLSKATKGQVDLPKLRAGRVGASIFTVGVNDPDHRAASIRESTLHFRRLADRYGGIQVVTDAQGLVAAFRKGRVAALFGLEGGDQIGGSLDVLRACHAAGVREMTLTWMLTNELGDSATDAPRYGGLSVFGVEVVREMNRLGMIVDLSHASEAAALQALETTDSPAILSHSSAYALCPAPRNASDRLLRRLATNGGVAMVTFVPEFTRTANWEWYAAGDRVWKGVKGRPGAKQTMEAWGRSHPAPRVTLADVTRHIEHVRRVAGIDHVGLGADFDGMDFRIEGLEDASKFPNLLVALARRGWSDADLRKLAGENFLRVLRRVEAVGHRLRGMARGALILTAGRVPSPAPKGRHPAAKGAGPAAEAPDLLRPERPTYCHRLLKNEVGLSGLRGLGIAPTRAGALRCRMSPLRGWRRHAMGEGPSRKNR